MLGLALAGCLETSSSGQSALGPTIGQPESLFSEYASFEPTVAVAPDGTVFATSSWGNPFLARHPNGVVERLDRPMPREAPFLGAQAGDVMIQFDDAGRLIYHALLYHYENNAAYRAFVLLGLHVAVSEDGGHTWPVNTYVSLPDSQVAPQLGADRQWLTVAADGTMVLIYQRVPTVLGPAVLGFPVTAHYVLAEPAVMVSRSIDGGSTWSDFQPISDPAVAVINGQPIATVDGTILVPYFEYTATGAALKVGISQDSAASFESHVVYTHADGPGAWFPSIVELEPGTLAMAWVDGASGLSVATSPDGGVSWSDAIKWSAPGETLATSPWALVHDDDLHVLWYRDTGEETSSLLWSQAPAAQLDAPMRAVVDPLVNGTTVKRAMTDFAHGVIQDGRMHMVWSDLVDPQLWYLDQRLD